MPDWVLTDSDLVRYYEAVDTVRLKLEQYVTHNLRLPKERIAGRVKQPEDITEKIKRKEYCVNNKDDVFRCVCDIAGTRVICDYLSEVEEVVDFVCNCTDFKVINILDFVKEPDCNGYRSWHVDVLLNTTNFYETRCEIQVRTIVQHSWAEKTHPLVYKKSKSEIPKLACEMLRNLSDQLYLADKLAENIKEYLRKTNEGL